MIQYSPTDDDCRFFRDIVILRAVGVARESCEPVTLTVLGKSMVVHPTHFGQIRAELNALLPQCDQQ